MMENKPGDEIGVEPPVPSNPVSASKVQETFANHKLNTSKDLIRNTVNTKDEILYSISDALKKNRHPFLKKITTMDDLGTLMSLYDSRSDTYGTPFLPVEGNMRCEGMGNCQRFSSFQSHLPAEHSLSLVKYLSPMLFTSETKLNVTVKAGNDEAFHTNWRLFSC